MRLARHSTISGATSSWPTPRERSSRPAPHNAKDGSNARMRGSRAWSVSSRWGSKKPARAWVARGPYAKVAARNGALLERVRELKADHPFWGYRRVWAYLRYIDGLTINQKRVYGVIEANDLRVKP